MTQARPENRYPVGKVLVLLAIVVAWVALDQWTKGFFAGAAPGQYFGSVLGGLIDFRLVQNTGAAWGVFAGNPFALGLFSLAVCLVLAVYFFVCARSINASQTVGIALIIAGGVGNAIDRFAQGYVTDFIATTFIDFPVFNVADIGVTCGVCVLALGMLLGMRNDAGEA